MHKSKSILLLKSFSEDELKRFRNFIESPYFNKNTRVVKLFDEIRKFYPSFTAPKLAKEKLYSKLYPARKYNEQVMKNIISAMLKLEMEFLSVDSFCSDNISRLFKLVSQLKYRQSELLLEREYMEFEKTLKDESVPSETMHYYLHMLEEEKFSSNILGNRQLEVTSNIEMSGEHLTVYFLKVIMRLSINNHVNKFSFNLNIEKNFPDIMIERINISSLLDYMEKVYVEDSLSVKLIYYAMKSIKDAGDDASYQAYKDLLYNNLDKLKLDEVVRFLHFMESICAQKINAGRHEFYADLFETYRHEIENKVLSAGEEHLTVMKFRNIYLTAVRVGNYTWAETFIHDFRHMLNEEERQYTVNMALAQLNFEKKDYDGTLMYINKIKTVPLFFKIDVNILKLMAFYELGHYESALSLAGSFKRMLGRNKTLTSQYRKKNINFVDSIAGLIKSRFGNNLEQLGQLSEKVKSFTELANKGWLLKKISEVPTG